MNQHTSARLLLLKPGQCKSHLPTCMCCSTRPRSMMRESNIVGQQPASTLPEAPSLQWDRSVVLGYLWFRATAIHLMTSSKDQHEFQSSTCQQERCDEHCCEGAHNTFLVAVDRDFTDKRCLTLRSMSGVEGDCRMLKHTLSGKANH